MRDDPGAPCPKCGAAAARQFFPAGIVFKGSGFYKTDSRGASSSSITSDGGESKSTSNGAKTDTSKSETKTPASDTSSTPTKKTASTDAAS
jgi:predicted nucleic acid-binding Zn ribbon protein